MMEIDGDVVEVMEEEDEDGTEIYAEEVGIEFNEESVDGFTATRPEKSGPVTIYRLIKLEHAEALGISLQEGSVTTPNQQTKIITRNIIKLNRPPRKMVLAQKNTGPQRLDAGDNRFTCQVCGKGFRHASHLKRHLNSHTGERMYDCEACPKRFLDASTLCRHRRTHTGDRPYGCRSCDKCFGTLGSLRRHVTVHDRAGRPHSCGSCAKRFPDASSLRKHKRIHAGVRPFACEACPKTFVHLGDLNGHRKVHEGERPWPCPSCGKRFSKQSNCARHQTIHDGESKEFLCRLCGVGYNFQSSLTRHLLTHRKPGDPSRQPRSKVVILSEVDQSEEGLEPSKLTLRHIKNLVRENKIDFGGEEGDDVCLEEDAPVIQQEQVQEVQKQQQQVELITETVVEKVSSEGNSEERRAVIVKRITESGDIKYVIEEA